MDVAGVMLRKKVFAYLAEHAHISYVDALAPTQHAEPEGGRDSVSTFSNMEDMLDNKDSSGGSTGSSSGGSNDGSDDSDDGDDGDDFDEVVDRSMEGDYDENVMDAEVV